MPPTTSKPAWGQGFAPVGEGRGIEVSKLHLAFTGKMDKRRCTVLTGEEMEHTPEGSGAWEVRVMLSLVQ